MVPNLNGTTTAAEEVFFIDSQCPQSESDRLVYNAASQESCCAFITTTATTLHDTV